ncbi:hypothetical protein [Chryseobacterium sp. JK1]|uniref:hypothetical protein n=1 Tax=Chryseobacterium sp. JK1 TaxID=874294 RepID=UPI003D68270F
MITPKEKAEEIRDKFHLITPSQISLGTESAKVSVDEITEILCNLELLEELKFWEEVKSELEKM